MSFSIFLDMDSVLTDFNKKLSEVLGRPVKKDEDFGNDSKIWKKIDEAGTKFWSDMEWMEDGKELWDYVKKFKPTILSSPTNHPSSIRGKKEWLKENLPKVPYILEHDKAKHAKSNAILIDDREKNIKDWEEADGIGILHTSAKSTIRKLEKIMEKEKEASFVQIDEKGYRSRVKLASLKEVVSGYLSREAETSVVNPFTGEIRQKPVTRDVVDKRQRLSDPFAILGKSNNTIFDALRALLSDRRFKDVEARQLIGKVLELKDADKTNFGDPVSFKNKSDILKKIVINTRSEGKISEDLYNLLILIFKDPKSAEDSTNAKKLITKIKTDIGILEDKPKGTELFSPIVTSPSTQESWSDKVKRIREMARQRSSKEAAEMINKLADRMEAILKEAGLL